MSMFPPIFADLSADAAVKAMLGDAPTRVYEVEAPPTPVVPYVVWVLVDNVPDATLDQRPTTDRATVQVDCYHSTWGGVRDLSRAVRDALEGHATMTGVVAHERTSSEPRLYRVALQFDYWLFR